MTGVTWQVTGDMWQVTHEKKLISIKSPFFARRAKKALDEGQSPPQELEESPRSGLYLLVILKHIKIIKYALRQIGFQLFLTRQTQLMTTMYIRKSSVSCIYKLKCYVSWKYRYFLYLCISVCMYIYIALLVSQSIHCFARMNLPDPDKPNKWVIAQYIYYGRMDLLFTEYKTMIFLPCPNVSRTMVMVPHIRDVRHHLKFTDKNKHVFN